MILIINEKRTHTEKLKKILNVKEENSLYVRGVFQNEEFVVIPLRGHIFGIPDLEYIDERFKGKTFKETKDLLPVLPPKNKFYPRVLTDRKFKKKFEIIKNFASVADKIILAPDPDFEGAALALEPFLYIKDAFKKIYAMMDMNNLNKEALKRELLKALKGQGLDYKTMAYIGLLRGDLNYGVGINVSRYLIGSLESKVTFGTQQSRLVDLIIQRTKEYFEFQKKKYYILKLKTEIGDFVLKLDDDDLKFDKNYIEKIKSEIGNIKEISIDSIKRETKKIPPPKWLDGSDAAQEASKILKIPAIKLMDEKTGLLEKMYLNNIVTYPRGESGNIMPLSEFNQQVEIAKAIAPYYKADKCDFSLQRKSYWYDDSKKSLGVNHTPFTIARSDININSLSKEEKVVFDILAKILLGIFYPDAEIEKKVLTSKVKETLK